MQLPTCQININCNKRFLAFFMFTKSMTIKKHLISAKMCCEVHNDRSDRACMMLSMRSMYRNTGRRVVFRYSMRSVYRNTGCRVVLRYSMRSVYRNTGCRVVFRYLPMSAVCPCVGVSAVYLYCTAHFH